MRNETENNQTKGETMNAGNPTMTLTTNTEELTVCNPFADLPAIVDLARSLGWRGAIEVKSHIDGHKGFHVSSILNIIFEKI